MTYFNDKTAALLLDWDNDSETKLLFLGEDWDYFGHHLSCKESFCTDEEIGRIYYLFSVWVFGCDTSNENFNLKWFNHVNSQEFLDEIEELIEKVNSRQLKAA